MGMRCVTFHYPSTRLGLAETAQRLRRFLASIPSPLVHFVGHSLGGLVIIRFCRDFPDHHRPGRIVLLGSPCGGSRAGRWLLGRPWGKRLAGPALEEAAAESRDVWRGPQPLGIVAGTLNIGLAGILGLTKPPADGVVSLDEASLPGADALLTRPVSHLGLLLSKTVAEDVGRFLKSGEFLPDRR